MVIREEERFLLTTGIVLPAATLAHQIAAEEDSEEGEAEGQPQAQSGGAQSGETNILAQLSESDRAAIRRIQEISGFSEIEVVQAYIACGKDEDLAADLLFTE